MIVARLFGNAIVAATLLGLAALSLVGLGGWLFGAQGRADGVLCLAFGGMAMGLAVVARCQPRGVRA